VEGAGVQRAEVGDEVVAVGLPGHDDHHRAARHDQRRRGEEAIEGGRVPAQAGLLQRRRVAEGRVRGGRPFEHAAEVRALRAAVVVGFGAVAQQALLAEVLLAGDGIRGLSGAAGHGDEQGHDGGRAEARGAEHGHG